MKFCITFKMYDTEILHFPKLILKKIATDSEKILSIKNSRKNISIYVHEQVDWVEICYTQISKDKICLKTSSLTVLT